MRKKYRIVESTNSYDRSKRYHGEYKHWFWPFWFYVRTEDGYVHYDYIPDLTESYCREHSVRPPSEFPKSLGWLP